MRHAIPPYRLIAVLAMSLVPSGQASAQVQGPKPNVLDRPIYQGHTAHAVVPVKYHVRNESGSDGSGLCVVSSVLSNGLAQRVPGLDIPGPGTSNIPGQYGKISNAPGKGSRFWKSAKSQPGGYDPYKLPDLIEAIYGHKDRAPAGARYVNIQSKDVKILQTLTHKGIPVGITVDGGAHMVSLNEFTIGGVAIWHDNNYPGQWHAESADVFARRVICPLNGLFWAFAWTKPIPTANEDGIPLVVFSVIGGLIFVIFFSRRKRVAATPENRAGDDPRNLLIAYYADRTSLP